MPMSNPRYVLVLAGGSGERFWPLSRRAKPKQLLKLLSDRSLLEDTLARLEGFVPPERVLILTNRREVLGKHANGPVIRVVATVVVAGISIMSLLLLGSTIQGWLGIG